MRNVRAAAIGLGVFLAGATAVIFGGSPSFAQKATLEELVSSVVHIKTFISPDGRTIGSLGRQREGSGVVIDDSGLVLTIGYLMVEAYAAEITTNTGFDVPANIVGYDHESGFGLLQAVMPPHVKPLPLGKSADLKERDPVVIAAFGGLDQASPAYVVSKREFAGNWEYMLDEAIFTAPPHPAWSGAALISREGKLVGVGSLIVPDANGKNDKTAGNMFVPIDLLPPIMADLISSGRIAGPGHPWLGMTTNDVHGHLFVSNVTPGGPADKAGIARGDIVVGVNGETAKGLNDFYRKVWARGGAGTVIPLDVVHGPAKLRVDVTSVNRLDYLKLKSTF